MAEVKVDSLKDFLALLLVGVAAGVLLYFWDAYVMPQLAKVGVPYGGIT